MLGPIDCCGLVELSFLLDGGRLGPCCGAFGILDCAGPALGPYSSSEDSSSKAISSSFARRVTLLGESGPASSSGVRLRFWRCGGSWGPIELILSTSTSSIRLIVASVGNAQVVNGIPC